MNLKHLYLATSNVSKIKEFQDLLGDTYILKSLLNTSAFLTSKITTIAETGTSFAENALIKARTFSEIVNRPAIADDSGLEIAALDNFPGIYSSRWINSQGGVNAANKAIVKKMTNFNNRSCRYVTAIAYVDVQKNISQVFVATLAGEIVKTITCRDGFGFDAIFYLPKIQKILTTLTIREKNQISQRAVAMQQLLAWMKLNE